MADFTSALYLGLAHGHADLRPWRRLTAGAPAALVPPAGSRSVTLQLARLVGSEAATLGVSTLHLFWDLCGQLRRQRVQLLADATLYPVGRWGVERAAAAKVPVASFAHQDPGSLLRQLARSEARGKALAPWVVTDGLCPDCGRVAPLDRYLALVEERGGWLLVDDSQALGLLGRAPGPRLPYGRGGGGSPSRLGIASSRLLTLSSLAKSFGAPLAVLTSAGEVIADFERASETRVYSSPPAVASIRAAEAALRLNRERGDELRARLVERVRQFRLRLRQAGLAASGGLFPIQNLELPRGVDPEAVFQRLWEAGIRTVLRQPRCRPGLRLTFLIHAGHEPAAIDRAVETLARVVRLARRACDERLELGIQSR